MKQPKSKLPFKSEKCFAELKNGENCWCSTLVSSDVENNNIIPYGEACKQDVEYIVGTCNNFPKAVELLREVVTTYEHSDNLSDLYFQVGEINKFLKEIEE